MKTSAPSRALREAALRLAQHIPRERLHPAVLAWANSATGRGMWGVAFSGGADSLALLLLLWAHWPERRRRLVALHFDHRLRGAASRADAMFCRRVARALGIKFVGGSWARPPAQPSEAAAREARHGFFARHARIVWFGHQQDDVAETMLMRLARGSGTGGLAAPRPVQRFANGRVYLRPLLTLKKEDIVATLRALGASWREDASNAGELYFRNRIRGAVLPVWQASAGRDALAGAALARELLEEDDTALEQIAAGIFAGTRSRPLALATLSGQPRAVVRRVVRRWLGAESRAGELSRQAFDALLVAVERGAPTRQSLGRHGFAVIRGGRLQFEPGRKNQG